MSTDKVRENRLRRWADRLGYSLHKDRARNWSLERRGEYMLVDTQYGAPQLGWNYDASLDEIEEFLAKEEAALRQQVQPELVRVS